MNFTTQIEIHEQLKNFVSLTPLSLY